MEDMNSVDLDSSVADSGMDQTQDMQQGNIDSSVQAEPSSYNWNDIGLDPTVDKRFNSMWKSPADLFKWTKELEKTSEKNNQNLNQFKKQVEELSGTKTEYSNLMNYIQMLSNDPMYGQQLNQLLDQFNNNLTQQKYGANLPPDLIKEIEENRNFRSKYESEQKLSQEKAEWNQTFTDLEQWSSKYGVDFGNEAQKEFVDILFKYQEKVGRNITPIEAKNLFFEIATPQVFEKSKLKGQEAAVSNLKRNSLASAVNGNKAMNKIEPKRDAKNMSFSDYFNSRNN